MAYGIGKERWAWVAMALPLAALAACAPPQAVSAENGLRCEAMGNKVGSDAYMKCARDLAAEPQSAVRAAAPTPPPVSPAKAVCDAGKPTETPIARYAFKDDMVFDRQTGLTWQRCSVGQDWKENVGCVGAPQQMTWDRAMTGGRLGWRVPRLDELLTLASPTCKLPAVNDVAFPNMNREMMWYWTSTPNGSAGVWGVDFRDGKSSYADRDTGSAVVRMVRGGK